MIHKLVIFIISLTFLFSCNGHKNGESAANLAKQLSIQKNKLDMVEVETIDAAFKAFQYNVGNLNRCVDSFSIELGNALNYYKGIKKINLPVNIFLATKLTFLGDFLKLFLNLNGYYDFLLNQFQIMNDKVKLLFLVLLTRQNYHRF